MLRPVLFLMALTFPASADGPSSPVSCYCTNSTGARVELGETACLQVGGRAFMAFCEMAQNVPIWRDTGEACVIG